jgi:hypothetical protein
LWEFWRPAAYVRIVWDQEVFTSSSSHHHHPISISRTTTPLLISASESMEQMEREFEEMRQKLDMA